MHDLNTVYKCSLFKYHWIKGAVRCRVLMPPVSDATWCLIDLAWSFPSASSMLMWLKTERKKKTRVKTNPPLRSTELWLSTVCIETKLVHMWYFYSSWFGWFSRATPRKSGLKNSSSYCYQAENSLLLHKTVTLFQIEAKEKWSVKRVGQLYVKAALIL